MAKVLVLSEAGEPRRFTANPLKAAEWLVNKAVVGEVTSEDGLSLGWNPLRVANYLVAGFTLSGMGRTGEVYSVHTVEELQ